MLTYPLFMIFPVAMVFAATHDALTMKIPNKVSILLVVGFLIAAPLAGLPWAVIAAHFGVALAVLIVGFLLFNLRILGGGDAKLIAAASLWIGSQQLLNFLLATTLVGAALCLAMLAYRRVPQHLVTTYGPNWLAKLHDKTVGVPYGIAIGAGALLLYPDTPLFRALVS